MDQTTQPAKNSLRIILVLILAVFFLFVLILYKSQNKGPSQRNFDFVNQNQITPTDEQAMNLGSLSLQLASPAGAIRSGQAFQVDVIADSAGSSIVGFDTVLETDQEVFQVVRAVSLLDDFTIYPLSQTDSYTVTASKELSSKTPSLFANTPIVRYTILPKKTGTLVLTLASQKGAEKTQLIDEKTQAFIPSLGELTVEVE